MNKEKEEKIAKIKSFVRRGRITSAQRSAIDRLWPVLGIENTGKPISFTELFQKEAPVVLEIGFGSGHSLLEAAKTHPEYHFIGIETHLPGIGTLLQHIQIESITNLRIFHADAVEVLHHCIPDQQLAGVQIFFPDPWPKRKHHKRRLIQPHFVQTLTEKLKSGGALHVATDWENYAKHIMNVLSAHEPLINPFGQNQYANRSLFRPQITRFEQRGYASGRPSWEIQFLKK